MNRIFNRVSPVPGARYRPVSWSNLYQAGTLLGYGLDEKLPGATRYKPVAWKGEVHPFKTKKDAQLFCDALNNQSMVVESV